MDYIAVGYVWKGRTEAGLPLMFTVWRRLPTSLV